MISTGHREEIQIAKYQLTNLSYSIRLMNLLGKPVEFGMNVLPAYAQNKIHEAVSLSLRKAISIVNRTVPRKRSFLTSTKIDRAAAILSGGTGGFFGLAGLTVELPVSTAIMLRSIINIARANGIDVTSAEGKLNCMEIFALGGGSALKPDENSYYATRAMLAKTLEESAKYIVRKGLIEEGSPPIVKFMARVVSRFGVTVSDKIAVEMIPVIGAITGASINLIFINHFIQMAEGHFTIKRLESVYGFEEVRACYNLPES